MGLPRIRPVHRRVQSRRSPGASGTYLTQEGDTFWIVSKKLHIPLQELLDANSDISPMNVYAGLTFKLPNGAQHQFAAAGKAKVLEASASPEQGAKVKTASGKKLSYSQKLTAVATAYTGSAAENGGWAGIDYFGNASDFGMQNVNLYVLK